jgi:FkbM family methyltransferase
MIDRIGHYARNSLWGYFWQRWKQWSFEHYTLPSAVSHSLEGVTLSLEGLSLCMKRAILKGAYEKAEIAISRKLIREGDNILELGGAIGFVGLFCLTQMKASRVISVEANPETAEQLKHNYGINQRLPEFIVAAVSASDGTAEFNVGAEFWEDSLTSRSEHLRRIAVRTISLPSLLNEAKCCFSCLLIDVEGAEAEIGWESVPSSVETIIIEIHPELVGFPASFRVLNKFQNLGFDVICHVGNVYGLKRDGDCK